VEWILAEAQAASGHVEAAYTPDGVRREPVLRLLADEAPSEAPALGPDDVLLVTGGGKGIGAEIALDQARRTGAALILLGRATPGRDAELAANLERMRAAGVRVHYAAADVTDAAATAAALAGAQAAVGPITALLHAAGANQPQPLRTLTEETFRRTAAVKVTGLQNALAAVDPCRLRLLVTFGSVIARAGMRGEADYAVANDWLRLATERYRADHPGCTCLALEWSVWSGVGMGERLGTVDALSRAGITPIPPDEGVALFDRLVRRTLPTVTVVVTGRLGAAPTVRWEKRDLPLLRFLEEPRIHYPDVELVTEATLSTETDPYLEEHRFQGELLFPAVVGLEAMAQSVFALTGQVPRVFEAVEFSRPVVVSPGRSTAIRSVALVREPGCVEVALRSEATGYQADHFRALCRTGEAGHAAAATVSAAGTEPATAGAHNLPGPDSRLALDPDADLYGGFFFQEGRFRRVKGYRLLMARECVAEVAPGPEGTAWFGQFLPGGLLLSDPGARDAALHAIQVCVPDSVVLPVRVDRIALHGRPRAGETLLVHARERNQEGDRFLYDLAVYSEDGRLLERWDGLLLHRVRQSVQQIRWVEPLLGPYAERRAAQLLAGWGGRVAVEAGEVPRRQRSDRAIQRAVGRPVPVHRRPDGKPTTASDLAVSAAHSGEVTLAVAGPAPVGCDLEAVTGRPLSVWADLLGSERLALAQLVSREAGEGLDVAATRVWAAAESQTKAGILPTAPLVLRQAHPDGWVVFGTAGAAVATGYATGKDGRPLVLALLGRERS
jgi:enediyne polyketide synthase